MTAHASIFAREIPWTEESGRLKLMDFLKKFGHYLATKQQQHDNKLAFIIYTRLEQKPKGAKCEG